MKIRTAFLSLFLLIFLIRPAFGEEPASRAQDPEDLSSLAIPESLGKIQQRFVGNPGRWVIYIQDVHAHLAAQENIEAILDHLATVYDIRIVALEGGWSESSFPKSWGLPSSKEKQTLARSLLEEDILTGPAMTALFSNMPITLIGLEDRALYEKNRAGYLDYLGQRDSILSKVKNLEKQIAAEKTAGFNAGLAAFDASLDAFRDGKKAEKFLPSLLAESEKQGVDLTDLDQALLFKEILEKEKAMDKTKLKSESERLVLAFKNSGLNFEELLRSGKVPAEKLELYPEAKTYLEIMQLQDKMDQPQFFNQIEEAITRLKEKLFASQEERDLDARSERFRTAKKLLGFQATPRDLKSYEAETEKFSSELSGAGLSDGLRLALEFYETAKQRDGLFIQTLGTHPKLAKGNIAMVAGGFHAEGLASRLTELGISHLIITPSLGDQAPDEALYFKRLQDTVQSGALSDMQNRFLTPAFDAGFVQAAQVLHQSRNTRQAVETVNEAIAGRQAAPEGRSAGAKSISAEDFLKLPPERQLALVEKWLEKAKAGKQRVVIVAKTSSLQKIFRDPSGLSVWKNILAPDRFVSLGELRDNDEYLTEMIGAKAQVLRIPFKEGASIEDVLSRKFHEAFERKKVAVIDPDYKNDNVLSLPAEPASLLLARLILEYGSPRDINPDFIRTLNSLLEKTLEAQGLLEQAA